MAWVKLDDAFPDNRKFLRAGPLAGYLHIAAIAWSNRNLTDGLIPREQPPRLAAWHVVNEDLDVNVVGKVQGGEQAVSWASLVGRLIEEGLWVERSDGDYEIHDYLEYQRSSEEIRELSTLRAKAGKHGGSKQKRSKPLASVKQNGSKTEANAKQNPNPKKTSISNEIESSSPGFLNDLLANLIEDNGARRPPIGKKWADAERLMLKNDGRDQGEAERVLRWCQRDGFWRAVILSMPKFREKYDTLRLQMERPAVTGRESAGELLVALEGGAA